MAKTYFYTENETEANWFLYDDDLKTVSKLHTTDGQNKREMVGSVPGGATSVTEAEYLQACDAVDAGNRLGSHPNIVQR